MAGTVSIVYRKLFGGKCVIYGYGMMYQTLDRYVENDIDEIEHAFVPDLKWPSSYLLVISNDKFWSEIQDLYDIYISKEDRERIYTVADLKRMIEKRVQGII